MTTENITLFFQQGSSDKVYKASLEKKGRKYIVNFAFGRRGSTLKTGTKTQEPLEYEKAKKIYDKLVNSKSAKGYVPHEDTTNYVYTSNQVSTGVHCQLLNPINAEEAPVFMEEDTWWAQEKKDGRRMLIWKKEDVTAINRKGFSIGAPEPILAAVQHIQATFLIDGEAIGEKLFVFDLLEWNDEDIRNETYQERLEILEKISFGQAIQVVKTAKTTEEKQALYQDLKSTNSEGIVFKEHSALYTAGRPNSGGTQRKFKFYDTASVVVSKVNDKRSVAMMVFDGDKKVEVGNVTIAVNQEIPPAGSIIEVRYLYAYKGGSLYQPTFLNLRTDLEKKECIIQQLKYKKEV